jgi:hypothetical protein
MQFDNKIFWIKYPPGAGGAFLALIAGQLLWPELAQVEDFPDKGHADACLVKWIEQGLVITPKTRMFDNLPVFDHNFNNTDTDNMQDHICWLPQNIDLIIPDHDPPNTWSDSQQKFPNSRYLIITVSEQMRLRFYANVYHKREDRSKVYLPKALKNLELAWANSPARRGLIKNLPAFNLPDWAVEILCLNRCQDWPCDQVDQQTIWQPETRYHPDIEQLIWRVDLWRIIHDHEQLLLELAQWLGCEVNNTARSTWANYVQRQHQLLPWINDQ